MFTRVAIVGEQDGIDLQAILEGCTDHLGTAHYEDTASAYTNMHFDPDLVLLNGVSDRDIQLAGNVPKWKGKLVCVDDGKPDQHHAHKNDMHYCDLANLQDVVREVLQKTKLASSH